MASGHNIILYLVGSFNPITNIHLRLFELARDCLRRKGHHVLSGVMSPVSDGYGKAGLLNASHRQAMVSAALQNNCQSSQWVFLDSWESDQPKWTPTRIVKERLQSLLAASLARGYVGDNETVPLWVKHAMNELASNGQLHNRVQRPNVQFKMVCGADVLESFAVPGLWDENDKALIVKEHGIVCIQREGSNVNKFIYETDVLHMNEANIDIVTDWMNIGISSTKVRRALRRGESVRYVIPDPVYDYISAHKLYSFGLLAEQGNNNSMQETAELVMNSVEKKRQNCEDISEDVDASSSKKKR